MKGHIKIELHDENTGEDKSYEQDNLITNALADILGLAAQADGVSADHHHMASALPAAVEGLGGLFLFDGTLTEDANNVHFPMGVHLTGHAGQGTDTASKMGGSKNTAESGKTDTGYVTVWDFSTSQANGTIASLGLTHETSGTNPFSKTQFYADYYSVDNEYGVIGYDDDKGIVYLYYQGIVYNKQIYKNKITAYSPRFGTETQVFDFAFSSYGGWEVFNGYDGYVYAVNRPYVGSSGTVTLTIRKLNLSTMTEETGQTVTVPNATCEGSRDGTYSMDMNGTVSNGYVYFIAADAKSIYQVNLSNTADVKNYTFGSLTIERLLAIRGGGVFALMHMPGTSSSGTAVSYYTYGYIYPDGVIRYDEESISTSNTLYMNSYMNYETAGLLRFYGYRKYMYFGFATNYLGSICNLETPVTKTSAQSMKITYTLTDNV